MFFSSRAKSQQGFSDIPYYLSTLLRMAVALWGVLHVWSLQWAPLGFIIGYPWAQSIEIYTTPYNEKTSINRHALDNVLCTGRWKERKRVRRMGGIDRSCYYSKRGWLTWFPTLNLTTSSNPGMHFFSLSFMQQQTIVVWTQSRCCVSAVYRLFERQMFITTVTYRTSRPSYSLLLVIVSHYFLLLLDVLIWANQPDDKNRPVFSL